MLLKVLFQYKVFFCKQFFWFVGFDVWVYDFGNFGVYQVLVLGENVNLFIIDLIFYFECVVVDVNCRKKDIGFYVMNFGNVYVVFIVVYSFYIQVFQVMDEVDKFNGFFIVLVYFFYFGEYEFFLIVFIEIKKVVDFGYWFLYWWNFENEKKGEFNFFFDFECIKKEFKVFFDRDNQFIQMMWKEFQFGVVFDQDFGIEICVQQKCKVKDVYNQFLEGFFGVLLIILFGFDGGNVQFFVKWLGIRGCVCGLKIIVMVMEDYLVEDLLMEENIVFIILIVGQGEFFVNGKFFWDVIKDSIEFDFVFVKYFVFFFGDSYYWFRKEDKVYYNKFGKDFDRVLVNFGGFCLVFLGFGDDQDLDGYQIGYFEWEFKFWEVFGVLKVDGFLDEFFLIINEDIKIVFNFLCGIIVEEFLDIFIGVILVFNQ